MTYEDSSQFIRDDRDFRDTAKEIWNGAVPFDAIRLPSKNAVYGIITNATDCLPDIVFGNTDFLYLGKSSDLLRRGHFVSGKTSSSTLRRTLGSILKRDLKLVAYARGRGRSRQDITHFRFDTAGEKRLTEWMKDQLRIGFSVILNDSDETEGRLIRYCEPVLNLTLWPNPQAIKIKNLRKICADEAWGNGPLRR